MIHKVIGIVLITLYVVEAGKPHSYPAVGTALSSHLPCLNSSDLRVEFESGGSPEEENQYRVILVNVQIQRNSVINVKFDSAAQITLTRDNTARISSKSDKERKIQISFFKDGGDIFIFKVKGLIPGIIPYITSIQLNTYELCEHPRIGFLDDYLEGYKIEEEVGVLPEGSESSCGKRKVLHTELIVNGLSTKPGDWPWHVALYRTEKSYVKYICGGTLISKTTVLTAAHCVTTRGKPIIPERLHVVLGKHNLYLGDSNAQEIDVHEVKVNEQFTTQRLDNDIALLKLKNEVTFSDFVQPACIWNANDQKKLPFSQEYGTVVGWGLNAEEIFETELKKVNLPKLAPSTCIKSNPVFFSNVLNSRKFCAGYNNGTSPCNGDSGGGFHMFVPNISGDDTTTEGSWHVRGVVSLGVSRQDEPICNPNEYVLFTDVAPFRDWIVRNT